jgi:hypothetical protein
MFGFRETWSAPLRPHLAAHAKTAGAVVPYGEWRQPRAKGLTDQRKLPVWPREYRPGCGKTHSPWGPAPTGIFAIRRPLAVDMA